MRFEQLYFLIEVAKTNSINFTAEQIYVTQQAISEALDKLEKELGVMLLHRTHKGVYLTEAGEVVAQKAKKVIDDIEDIKNYCENYSDSSYLEKTVEISGNLTVEIATSISKTILPKVIPIYAKIHPNVHLNIKEKRSMEIIDDMKNGEADVAVLVLLDKVLKDLEEEMFIEKLAYSKWYLVAKKSLPLAKKKSISLKEIMDYPLAFYYPSGDHLFISFLEQYGKPKIAINTNSSEVYVNAIREGIAVGFVNGIFLKNTKIHDEDLVFVPISKNIKFVVCLVCLDYNQLTKPAFEFVKIFKKHAPLEYLNSND